MSRLELFNALGLFALVVMVVFSGTYGVGAAVSNMQTEPEVTDFTPYEIEADALPTSPVETDRAVSVPAASEQKTVIVDLRRGNGITRDQMQPLVAALVRAGHDVRFYSGKRISQSELGPESSASQLNRTLRAADAFVVVDPRRGYSRSERNGIEAFADAGGRVVVVADPVSQSRAGSPSVDLPIGGSAEGALSFGQPTNVATQFGFSFSSGYLFNLGDDAHNFKRIHGTPNVSGPLTVGVDRIVVREAASIATDSSVKSVITAGKTRLSSNRRADRYTIVARSDNVTAVGATSLLRPAMVSKADNGRFLSNLAGFLVSGNKTTGERHG